MSRKSEMHDLEDMWERHLSLLNITLAVNRRGAACDGNNRLNFCGKGRRCGATNQFIARGKDHLLS